MPGVPTAPTIFDSTRPLLYNVEPWASLGFGVPNFGRNVGTASLPIWRLVDEIGANQLYIMTADDARRAAYPSPNTVSAIAKMINQVQSVLAGRQKQPNDLRLQPGHAASQPRPWQIHPVPFFPGPMVSNGFLMEYNALCMIALTNMMRHSDNDLALSITSDFAQDCWQYFREIKILCCTELLSMKQADAADDAKLMPVGPYAGPGTAAAPAAGAPVYNPPATTVNTQRLQSPGAVFSQPTPDDLQPFVEGIPANLLIPNLAQYPVGPLPGIDGLSGENTPSMSALAGVGATSGPGGSMGSAVGLTPAAKAVLDATRANIGPAPGVTDGAPVGPAQIPGAAAAGGAAPGAAPGVIGPPNT